MVADKFEIELTVRRIDNGYVVTGNVEKFGVAEYFPEEYFKDLSELDMAISTRLADAEAMASKIERPEMSTFTLRGW